MAPIAAKDINPASAFASCIPQRSSALVDNATASANCNCSLVVKLFFSALAWWAPIVEVAARPDLGFARRAGGGGSQAADKLAET